MRPLRKHVMCGYTQSDASCVLFKPCTTYSALTYYLTCTFLYHFTNVLLAYSINNIRYISLHVDVALFKIVFVNFIAHTFCWTPQIRETAPMACMKSFCYLSMLCLSSVNTV